jgi:hypothetical protein
MTKYNLFFSRFHSFKVSTIPKKFMETIQKLHGVPKIIVSDIDPISTRKFWIELFSCFRTQLDHKSSYHPQSDEKTHIWNECI